jgi:hypothetical protein
VPRELADHVLASLRADAYADVLRALSAPALSDNAGPPP